MRRILAFTLALLLALGCCGTALAAGDDGGVVDFLPETKPAPGDDLYGAVNFDAVKAAEMPAGYSMWSAAVVNDLEISEELNEMLDEYVANAGTWEKGTPEQKIADLYLSYVDEASRDAVGIEPLRPYLDAINGASNVQEYAEAIASMKGDIGYVSLLDFGVDVDVYDSTRYAVYASPADLGLGKAYLEDESMSFYWDAYKTLLTRLFTLYGLSEAEAAEKTEAIFDLQTKLAASSLSEAELYDYSKAYLPKTLDEVAALLPTIDMAPVLEAFKFSGIDQFLVVDVGQLEAVGQVLTEENLQVLKDFSTATLLKDMSSWLGMDYRQAYVDYTAAMNGVTPRPLAEASKDSVKSDLEWDFAKLYVAKYFPEESKQYVLDMTGEIVDWFDHRIDQLDWMGDETKAAAKKKLDTLTVKIGYPDSYDFVAYLDDVEYVSPADGGSLIENRLAACRASSAYSCSLLGQPVDKTAWSMTPQTVNAYYDPTANEIVFPAGIIRGVFYDPDASRAFNLGGIGDTIAHELTHAFDSSGAQFDENGNLNMWWTEEDYANFTALQQDVIDYYEAFPLPDGLAIDGELTLGENIADLGALHCVAELCGSDPEALREMFDAYAASWAEKAPRANYDYQLRMDPHAPGVTRTNAVVSSTDAFYEAYDVQEGDGMYVAPEDRVGIW